MIFYLFCQGLKVKKTFHKIVGYQNSNATLKCLWLHCDRVHFCAKKTLTDVISVCSLVVIWLGNKTNEMWKRKSSIVEFFHKSTAKCRAEYFIRFYLNFNKKNEVLKNISWIRSNVIIEMRILKYFSLIVS